MTDKEKAQEAWQKQADEAQVKVGNWRKGENAYLIAISDYKQALKKEIEKAIQDEAENNVVKTALSIQTEKAKHYQQLLELLDTVKPIL